jgi:hypothetical protein
LVIGSEGLKPLVHKATVLPDGGDNYFLIGLLPFRPDLTTFMVVFLVLYIGDDSVAVRAAKTENAVPLLPAEKQVFAELVLDQP